MRNKSFSGIHARRVVAVFVAAFAACVLFSELAFAAAWNGIEPLKSRRADVERILGKPTKDQPGENGTLYFNVAGGKVTVAFVSAKFVATKKLSPSLEGTVLQVVLQHENSNETPESLGLAGKSDFTRDEAQGLTKYTNLKDGIVYTFMGGKLKTSYYVPAQDQWTKSQGGLRTVMDDE